MNNYRWRFVRLVCSRTRDDTTGDKPKTWTSGDTYFGAEEITQANRETSKGVVRNVKSGTIRLRNFPTLTTTDRLQGGRFDTTYEIDGIRYDYDTNETIVDVHSLETY